MNTLINSNLICPILNKMKEVSKKVRGDINEGYFTVENGVLKIEVENNAGYILISSMQIDYVGKRRRFKVDIEFLWRIVNSYDGFIRLELGEDVLKIIDYDAESKGLKRIFTIPTRMVVEEDYLKLPLANVNRGEKVCSIKRHEFKDMIKKALIIANGNIANGRDSDHSRKIGLILNIDEKYIECIASDGYRIVFKKYLEMEAQRKCSVFFRSECVKLMDKIFKSDNDIEMYLGKDHILFGDGIVDFYCVWEAVSDSELEMYKKVADTCGYEENVLLEIDRRVFKEMLERVSVVDKIKPVFLEIKNNGELKMSCKGGKKGNKSEGSINVKSHMSVESSVCANMEWIKQGLSEMYNESIYLSLHGNDKLIKIVEKGEDNRYIVMPLR